MVLHHVLLLGQVAIKLEKLLGGLFRLLAEHRPFRGTIPAGLQGVVEGTEIMGCSELEEAAVAAQGDEERMLAHAAALRLTGH